MAEDVFRNAVRQHPASNENDNMDTDIEETEENSHSIQNDDTRESKEKLITKNSYVIPSTTNTIAAASTTKLQLSPQVPPMKPFFLGQDTPSTPGRRTRRNPSDIRKSTGMSHQTDPSTTTATPNTSNTSTNTTSSPHSSSTRAVNTTQTTYTNPLDMSPLVEATDNIFVPPQIPTTATDSSDAEELEANSSANTASPMDIADVRKSTLTLKPKLSSNRYRNTENTCTLPSTTFNQLCPRGTL
jgi:hypothetical protein